jgi:hypothetical protein
MRWADERYVRLYTRDTVDWLALSFEAQALLALLMRKLDRAGLLELGKHGKRAVAVAIGHAARWPVLEPALEELLADGCVRVEGDTLVMPNFIEAQEAAMSDRQRKAEQRARARDLASLGRDVGSRNVTDCPEVVTDGPGESQKVTPSHAVPCRAEPEAAAAARAGAHEATPTPSPELIPVEAPAPPPPDAAVEEDVALGLSGSALQACRRVERQLTDWRFIPAVPLARATCRTVWEQAVAKRGADLVVDVLVAVSERVKAKTGAYPKSISYFVGTTANPGVLDDLLAGRDVQLEPASPARAPGRTNGAPRRFGDLGTELSPWWSRLTREERATFLRERAAIDPELDVEAPFGLTGVACVDQVRALNEAWRQRAEERVL